MIPAVLVAVFVIAWLVIDRANELFCLSWRNGELRLVRGAIPTVLKNDLADALTRMKAPPCTVKAKREEQGARLTAPGLDDFSEQRLRNILQIYPVATLRSAQQPHNNKLLRFFGFASLLWIFGTRDD